MAAKTLLDEKRRSGSKCQASVRSDRQLVTRADRNRWTDSKTRGPQLASTGRLIRRRNAVIGHMSCNSRYRNEGLG
jgi:hypothetical protein